MKEILEISKKLDFSLQISLSVTQEIGLLFAKLDEAIPLSVSMDKKTAEIYLYLDMTHRVKYEPVLGRLKHLSKGGYDIYELEAEELLSEFQLFRELILVPSVVPGGLYFRGGYVYADFRFHHSALAEISKIVKKVNCSSNRIKLSYLGRTKGLINTMKSINSRIPLTAIAFSYRPEDGYVLPEDLAAEPIVEAKIFSIQLDACFDNMYYAIRMKEPGRVIDEEEGIFESKYRTRFMKALIDRAKIEKLPAASLIGKYGKGLVENIILVPSFLAEEVLSTIFSVSEAIGEETLRIDAYASFEEYLEHMSLMGGTVEGIIEEI